MYSVKEPDGGTPKRVSEQMVTLEIDGVRVVVPAGTSVMRAAIPVSSDRAVTSGRAASLTTPCRPESWRGAQ